MQPPISGGSASRRFRSTLRLVSLLSFPKERGRAWPGGGRIGDQQKPPGSVRRELSAFGGRPLPLLQGPDPSSHWSLGTPHASRRPPVCIPC